MGHIGNGYGSECHLLRFLGRHRDHLNKNILEKIGADRIEWRDFNFNGHATQAAWYDAELRGLDFLDDPGIRRRYGEFFPQHAQNWDAIGRLWKNSAEEILLVEAKAHAADLCSNCSAAAESLKLINSAFAETKSFLGATNGADWTRKYYQYCNRLATLYFLNEKADVPAQLLFIYFIGDRGECYGGNGSTFDRGAKPGKGFECPQTEADWEKPIAEMEQYLGLPSSHKLSGRVHQLFLDVQGR